MSLPWSARLHATSPYARNILLRHGLRPKVSNDNQLDVEWSKEFPCVVISETNIQISMLLPLSQLARPHATTPNSNYTNFMEGSSTPAPKPWKPKDLSNQSITPPPSSTMLATTPKTDPHEAPIRSCTAEAIALAVRRRFTYIGGISRCSHSSFVDGYRLDQGGERAAHVSGEKARIGGLTSPLWGMEEGWSGARYSGSE